MKARSQRAAKVEYDRCRYLEKRQFAATPPWLTEAQLRKIDSIYAAAAREGREVDHIVPLGGKNVCDLHVPRNMQLLSADENKRKSNKSML